MIEVQNVSFGYKSTEKILKNITINFENNQIHGLVGNNGEGKTTLFNCIFGLLKTYEGTILESENLSIRKNTGFLPTDLYFYPRITGKEYIEFLLLAKKKPVILQEILQWNELFELPLNEYAETYSTGMKKKVALLALIMQKNKYLLLDEPFNGVDFISNMLLKEILLKLKNTTTIILTSHILESLTGLCDGISYLKSGEILRKYLPFEYNLIENDVLQHSLEVKIEKLNLIDF